MSSRSQDHFRSPWRLSTKAGNNPLLPGEGNGNPLQYSCLENSMDRGTWWATAHGESELDTTEWLTLSLSSFPSAGRYLTELGVPNLIQWANFITRIYSQICDFKPQLRRWPLASPLPTLVFHFLLCDTNVGLKPGFLDFSWSPEVILEPASGIFKPPRSLLAIL